MLDDPELMDGLAPFTLIGGSRPEAAQRYANIHEAEPCEIEPMDGLAPFTLVGGSRPEAAQRYANTRHPNPCGAELMDGLAPLGRRPGY